MMRCKDIVGAVTVSRCSCHHLLTRQPCHGNTRQHVATHCNTLQHAATRYNTLHIHTSGITRSVGAMLLDGSKIVKNLDMFAEMVWFDQASLVPPSTPSPYPTHHNTQIQPPSPPLASNPAQTTHPTSTPLQIQPLALWCMWAKGTRHHISDFQTH